ncbi:unnamed protein product [Clonostachys solani]|uniref:Uncharacterized protein n=1 Tax=Clonostachys solani TaxID=160281 RepID=A0A9P0EI16_9HYPO|nr:unnamed protein product [Clonostachys solani]
MPPSRSIAVASRLQPSYQAIAISRNPAVLQELTRQGFSAIRLVFTNKENMAQCKWEVEKLTGGHVDTLTNKA